VRWHRGGVAQPEHLSSSWEGIIAVRMMKMQLAYTGTGQTSGLDASAGASASVYGPRRGNTIHVISVSEPQS
jgi:hypothetical protein